MDEPRWLNQDEMRAWQGFLVVSSLLSRRIEQQLKRDESLSHPQHEVLVRLAAEGRRALRRAAPGQVALVRELFIDVLEPEQLGPLAEALEAVGLRLRGDDVPAS